MVLEMIAPSLRAITAALTLSMASSRSSSVSMVARSFLRYPARLRQFDGVIVRLQRAHVVALLEPDIAQQPPRLRMVRRDANRRVDLRRYLRQQIRRHLEQDAIRRERLVQPAASRHSRACSSRAE